MIDIIEKLELSNLTERIKIMFKVVSTALLVCSLVSPSFSEIRVSFGPIGGMVFKGSDHYWSEGISQGGLLGIRGECTVIAKARNGLSGGLEMDYYRKTISVPEGSTSLAKRMKYQDVFVDLSVRQYPTSHFYAGFGLGYHFQKEEVTEWSDWIEGMSVSSPFTLKELDFPLSIGFSYQVKRSPFAVHCEGKLRVLQQEKFSVTSGLNFSF